MDEAMIRDIVRTVLSGTTPPRDRQSPVLLEASARHVHLTREALEGLFGPGAELGVRTELSQPGEFLSDKRVKLITPKGEIENVAVLGPLRRAVQVELSATDCCKLGLSAPVNLSGDLTGGADVLLMGSAGVLEAKGSVIIAKAHVHFTRADAAAYGVRDGQRVRVRIESLRPMTLDDVIIRVRDNFKAAVHIDTDEANACCAGAEAKAYLLGAAPVCMAGEGPAAEELPLSWSEDFIAEKTAKTLAAGHEKGHLRLKKGVILTPAARDVFSEAHIQLEFM